MVAEKIKSIAYIFIFIYVDTCVFLIYILYLLKVYATYATLTI